ncbi:hypothetical protein ACFZBU_40710 [Embleya sp. NPDC008237]
MNLRSAYAALPAAAAGSAVPADLGPITALAHLLTNPENLEAKLGR